MRFCLTQGAHFHNGGLLSVGAVVETDQDLAAAFPDRFRRVEEEAGEDTTTTVEPEVHADTAEDLGGPVEAAYDVTFQAAAEKGLVVHQIGRLYFVYRSHDTTTPLNTKNLKRLRDVETFVAMVKPRPEETPTPDDSPAS